MACAHYDHLTELTELTATLSAALLDMASAAIGKGVLTGEHKIAAIVATKYLLAYQAAKEKTNGGAVAVVVTNGLPYAWRPIEGPLN